MGRPSRDRTGMPIQGRMGPFSTPLRALSAAARTHRTAVVAGALVLVVAAPGAIAARKPALSLITGAKIRDNSVGPDLKP